MHIPFPFEHRARILIAGAGGGYDFLCGLPIALALMEKGHSVCFANYSFTRLHEVQKAQWITPDVLKVDHNASMPDGAYFPEVKMSKWFKEEKGMDMPVYCYANLGVRPLEKVFRHLRDMLAIDGLIVVDGGVDGIFRGDEFDLGTPSMDSVSVIAGSLVPFASKAYVMTAFGSEGVNHEVSHADALARVAQLTKTNDFFGVSCLLANQSSCLDFLKAVRHILDRTAKQHHSNIVGSMVKAVEGDFGEMAVNAKTIDSPIWVSPLTNMFWYFDLGAVARMKLFYKDALRTDTVAEVADLIADIRKNLRFTRASIPI